MRYSFYRMKLLEKTLGQIVWKTKTSFDDSRWIDELSRFYKKHWKRAWSAFFKKTKISEHLQHRDGSSRKWRQGDNPSLDGIKSFTLICFSLRDIFVNVRWCCHEMTPPLGRDNYDSKLAKLKVHNIESGKRLFQTMCKMFTSQNLNKSNILSATRSSPSLFIWIQRSFSENSKLQCLNRPLKSLSCCLSLSNIKFWIKYCIWVQYKFNMFPSSMELSVFSRS